MTLSSIVTTLPFRSIPRAGFAFTIVGSAMTSGAGDRVAGSVATAVSPPSWIRLVYFRVGFPSAGTAPPLNFILLAHCASRCVGQRTLSSAASSWQVPFVHRGLIVASFISIDCVFWPGLRCRERSITNLTMSSPVRVGGARTTADSPDSSSSSPVLFGGPPSRFQRFPHAKHFVQCLAHAGASSWAKAIRSDPHLGHV